MRNWLKKHRKVTALLAFYGAGVVVLLCVQLAGLIQNKIAYANGSLAPQELSIDDFELVDIEIAEDGLLTLSGDPQMYLREEGRLVENVVLEFAYSRPPLMEMAFWAGEGQDHTLRQVAYMRDDGMILLPAAGAQRLRIDPGTQPGNQIEIQRIAINQPRPLYSFFVPSAGQVLLLVAVPALLYSAVMIALPLAKSHKKGGVRHG